MISPPISLAFKAAMLFVEAQQVIALRMLRLAAGGPKAERELNRMILEKTDAAAKAATTAIAATATGRPPSVVADRTISDYRRRVRKNRRRLA